MNARSKQASAPRQLEYRINRRLHHRYVMVMRDGFLHVGPERVPCVVRNISSGGLMARVYRPVDLGKSIKIELATGELIDGTVLWMKDWTIGVAFTGHVDIESILAEQWTSETDGDRRRTARHKVECPATLKVSTRFYFGKLCDLSPTGAHVQTRGMIKKPGDAVLALPDLPPLLAPSAGSRSAIAASNSVNGSRPTRSAAGCSSAKPRWKTEAKGRSQGARTRH